MEESLGQQYALQVALQTMKERCLQLQQRLSIVEEENMNLRVKYYVESPDVSPGGTKSETEILRQKVTQLTKQKSQLTHNVLMVASENKQLWSRLSKLTQTNQPEANDASSPKKSPSATPNPTTLIRSKTFTHETPPAKLVRKSENDTTCTDSSLEDISLKIINSIAQEKYELEKQCAQMVEMQSSESFLSSSIGFAYPHDELEDCTVGEIAHNMEKLIYIKDALIGQKEKLKKGFECLKMVTEKGVLCKSCKERLQKEKESQKLKPKEDVTTASSSKDVNSPEKEKVCPMCSKIFYKELLGEFVAHVESHFVGEDDMFLENFEVVPSTLRK